MLTLLEFTQKIFEMQTGMLSFLETTGKNSSWNPFSPHSSLADQLDLLSAAIRYALGSEHTYSYVDGSVPATMALGVEPLISSSGDEEFVRYADSSSSSSCLQALTDLEAFVEEEGPFDGVMAFSQGAALAASLLIHRMQRDRRRARLYPVFRCAVFFSGGVPEDPVCLEGVLAAERGTGRGPGELEGLGEGTGGRRRLLSVEQDGEIIEIATAHVWGRQDALSPPYGSVLRGLCKASEREEFVHDLGHEIPGGRDPEMVQKAVRVIRRTIERAETPQ